jgi:hypothetical protein
VEAHAGGLTVRSRPLDSLHQGAELDKRDIGRHTDITCRHCAAPSELQNPLSCCSLSTMAHGGLQGAGAVIDANPRCPEHRVPRASHSQSINCASPKAPCRSSCFQFDLVLKLITLLRKAPPLGRPRWGHFFLGLFGAAPRRRACPQQ